MALTGKVVENIYYLILKVWTGGKTPSISSNQRNFAHNVLFSLLLFAHGFIAMRWVGLVWGSWGIMVARDRVELADGKG